MLVWAGSGRRNEHVIDVSLVTCPRCVWRHRRPNGTVCSGFGRGRSATADNRINKVKNTILCFFLDVLGILRERTQIVLHCKSPETWNRGVIRGLSVCASARAAWAVLSGLAPVLSTQHTCFLSFLCAIWCCGVYSTFYFVSLSSHFSIFLVAFVSPVSVLVSCRSVTC